MRLGRAIFFFIEVHIIPHSANTNLDITLTLQPHKLSNTHSQGKRQDITDPGSARHTLLTMEGGGVISERQIPDTLSRALLLIELQCLCSFTVLIRNFLCFDGSELDNLLY